MLLGFSLGTPVFHPPQKPAFPNSNFDLKTVDERATLRKPLKFPLNDYLLQCINLYSVRIIVVNIHVCAKIYCVVKSYSKTTRNFNAPMGKAAKFTIAEVSLNN